jgi:uncharacterized SAM-binding protein YcdF (DUF218 family)
VLLFSGFARTVEAGETPLSTVRSIRLKPRIKRPTRRPLRRYKPIKLGRARWVPRALTGAGILILVLFSWAILARRFAPTSNTSIEHFDALIVLGTPADSDGNPTPAQQARVAEAVHEYERGVASHIIFTGGPAHNRFVEAEVMARTAEAQGIPWSAVVVEPRARNTIQNACFSARIMQERGWHSAEVVSNAAHLPRVALIFRRLPLEWRTQAAPPLAPESSYDSAEASAWETLKTVHYLTFSRWADRCQP